MSVEFCRAFAQILELLVSHCIQVGQIYFSHLLVQILNVLGAPDVRHQTGLGQCPEVCRWPPKVQLVLLGPWLTHYSLPDES